MSEKQLNFLNIFEPSKHEIENIDEDDVKNEEGIEACAADKDTEAKKEDLISESLIKREEALKKEAEIKLKRLKLLRAREDLLKIADFADIMPEIKAYEIRMLMLRASYEAALPGEDKQRAYQTLVNPDLHDEEIYRDSARLYLKYLEVAKQEMSLQAAQEKSHKKDIKTKPVQWNKGSGRDRAVEKFE
ncbi:MAG: hypothetical protein Q8Q67_02440 [bacterium]|nr:hypothetical protein [bacterium]